MWIDCEFNSFEGELISLALVAEDGSEFYSSLGCDEPHPWVAEHVMPIIGIEPEPKGQMQARLQMWLCRHRDVHIIADWPDDIRHLCETLIVGPGLAINTPRMTFELDRSLDGESAIPHNALEDARGNMRATLEREAGER